MLHYRQMAMLACTVIIGDMNAAPNPADRGGQATPQDLAVRETIQTLGLADLTANLEGQPSHFPHQTDAAPSRIDVCYGDPTTIIRAEARYGPLPLGPTGHSPTNDPATVLQATQDSFLGQHTPTKDTLDPDTEAKIDRLPRVFNHAQRRQLEKRPFTIREVRKAIHSLRQHKNPGYDSLPAEADYHLPAHLLRILAHRLWNIFTRQTPLPPDWANIVGPLYKKGDWANPDNWRPIVCAVTEVKIV